MFPARVLPHGTLGPNNEVSLKFQTKADLLNYVWLDLGTGSIGSTLGSNTNSPTIFELYIGGQFIDRQDATFASAVWHKFLCDKSAKSSAIITNDESDNTIVDKFFNGNFLPLHFFFCDGFYLPIVAMQYHEVEIRIKFGNGTNIDKLNFYANYINLDVDERSAIVKNPVNILIEQVQKIPSHGPSSSPKFDLSLLNHPVKCLIWGSAVERNSNLMTDDVQLYLNGSELFESRMPDKYFAHVQPYYHSAHFSELMKGQAGNPTLFGMKMYSFAMDASQHYPTGTCNFSRLDNAILDLKSTTGTYTDINLWAVNFNLLRIKNGVTGLAFSN